MRTFRFARVRLMLFGMRALPGRASRSTLAEPPSGVTRESTADAQRARIRRAAGELIAKRGYGGVSVELIVKRARVSFKTFYKLYGNKEEAFADLFDTTTAATAVLVREALAASERPWPEQVALALRTFFEAVLAEPLIARACLVEGLTAGPEILGRYEQIAKAFVPILSEGRRYNPDAKALPKTIEDTLAGAVLWSVYQRLSLSETDRIAELIPENVELVLRPYVGETEAARVAASGLAETSPV
jgi:AcrR family transcriptional regulator